MAMKQNRACTVMNVGTPTFVINAAVITTKKTSTLFTTMTEAALRSVSIGGTITTPTVMIAAGIIRQIP